MKVEELKEFIDFEFSSLEKILNELGAVLKNVGDKDPDVVQITALSGFRFSVLHWYRKYP